MYFVKMPLIITLNISGASISAGYVYKGLLKPVFSIKTEKYKNSGFLSLSDYIESKLILDIDSAIRAVKNHLNDISEEEDIGIHKLLSEKSSDYLPIGISFSGQIDEAGVVNSASSIFGKCKNINYDLKESLRKLYPSNEFFFINNISAASYSIAKLKKLKDKRFLVLHIGSGFGSKVFDSTMNSVILDRKCFSGEIGHITINKSSILPDCKMECDCGEINHLAAFVLKSGMVNIAEYIIKHKYANLAYLSKLNITENNVFDILGTYESTVGRDVLSYIAEIMSNVISTLILSIGIDHLVIKGSQFYSDKSDAFKNCFIDILFANIREQLGQYYSIKEDFIIDYIRNEEADRGSSMEGLYYYINSQTSRLSGIINGYIEHYSTITVISNNCFEFPIIRINDIFGSEVRFLKEMIHDRRVLIVIDEIYNLSTDGRLKESVEKYFENTDFHILSLSPSDEKHGEVKDSINLYKIIEYANKIDLPRNGMMIAVGGGVILDLVGFAAQQYRRMVDYIRIPTTLIGQIDAGIGIKVGINYKNAKNLIGGFYPPRLVINSFNFLLDLPVDAFECGISEILKIGIVNSRFIIDKLCSIDQEINSRTLKQEQDLKSDFIELMDDSIQKMLLQLSGNIYEKSDLKRLVDFGHTFSPVLESLTDYTIPHGFSVAVDMFICVLISLEMGLIAPSVFKTYEGLFKKYNLLIYPSIFEANTHEIFKQSVHKTILHRGGNLNLVLPYKDFGRAIFINLSSCSCLSREEYPYIIDYKELEQYFTSAVSYLKKNNVKVI